MHNKAREKVHSAHISRNIRACSECGKRHPEVTVPGRDEEGRRYEVDFCCECFAEVLDRMRGRF